MYIHITESKGPILFTVKTPARLYGTPDSRPTQEAVAARVGETHNVNMADWDDYVVVLFTGTCYPTEFYEVTFRKLQP
jgi:hypothetical protein